MRGSKVLRRGFVAAGRRVPALFDAFIRLREGRTRSYNTAVYSHGQSGTSSIWRSLQAHGVLPALHLHILWPPNAVRENARPPETAALYHRALVDRVRPRALRLVSVVRDPVSRILSNYFFDTYNHQETAPTDSVEDARAGFGKYLQAANDFQLDWFGAELAPATGIDVFAEPFPLTDGFRRYSRGHIELLVLRLELSDERKQELLADFFECPDFRLERLGHVAAKKAYGALYKEFCDCGSLPVEWIQQILETRTARHFLSDEERRKTIARWQGEEIPESTS